MSWNSIPVAILAGINLYVALLYLGKHLIHSRRLGGQGHYDNLAFSLVCLTVSLYEIACAGLYSARDLQSGMFWQKLNFAGISLMATFLVVFVREFARLGRGWITSSLCAYFIAMIPISLFVEGPLTLELTRPLARTIELPWGLRITYHEVEPGLLFNVQMVVAFLGFVYLLTRLTSYYRVERLEGRPGRGTLSIIVSFYLFFIVQTSDSLVAAGVLPFIYLTEYGWTIILGSMAYALLIRYAELYDSVDRLNINLEKANGDLTEALLKAQEALRFRIHVQATLSHELRAPLNPIINFAEGLIEEFSEVAAVHCSACNGWFQSDDGKPPDDLCCPDCQRAGALKPEKRWAFTGDADLSVTNLKLIKSTGHHLLGVINDLLDSSSLELGKAVFHPEPISWSEVQGEVISSLSTLAQEHHVELVSQPLAEELRFVADRLKLKQILYNLLSNAIKYSPEQGRVELRVELADPQKLRLSVVDQGIGIASADKAVIFEPFRQVDNPTTRKSKGTGLGLAITKQLVELHGGQIWVESEPGHGAAFWIELPRNRPERDRKP